MNYYFLMLFFLTTARISGNPLIEAVRANDIDAVRRHLMQNPEYNFSKDLRGDTALIAAARTGNDDIATILLLFNARLVERDAQGNTALAIARNLEHVAVADLIEHFIGPDDQENMMPATVNGQT